ncbi:endonuclease V [Microbulbifer sp. 2304DJ12-6]|uniref:endonuclease V n=1 Tax=Microbulbifer sp. 2304DJ12-6 TaxID=3233340 RepID=UPI0039B0DE17
MILAVDVDYRIDNAIVAGVTFSGWSDEAPDRVIHSKITNVRSYQSGQFYRREMPCILKLLNDYDLTPDIIVIDGYVVLGQELKPGLGMRLYETLDKKIPIIGVAKTAFKDSKSESEVFRGESKKPLYVTAVGIGDQIAKNYISSMHGKHRMPTLLKLVDRECRKG